MAHGTKGTFEGRPAASVTEQLEAIHRQIAQGELAYFDNREADLHLQGALLIKLGRGAILRHFYVPPPNRRGNAIMEAIPMYGLHPVAPADNDKRIGIEWEKFTVDMETGLPRMVRGYDKERGNFPLIPGASTTPEMTFDVDETDLPPVPLEDIGVVYERHVNETVLAFGNSGVGISPYAKTPHEVTEERLEKHQYTYGIVNDEPHDSYRKFFNVAGLQLHRAIRRHDETPDEALEFGAYAANRAAAFSWLLILTSAASPNLEGDSLIERYRESERLSKEEKDKIIRTYRDGQLGYSHRTLSRYAGSVSGGVHRQPLPEKDAHKLLALMHERLMANEASSPDRIAGEHGDTRLRYSIRVDDQNGSTGTFETSVPDTIVRPKRLEAIAYLYDGIYESLYEEWQVTNGRLVESNLKSQLLKLLLSADGGKTITTADLERYRTNSIDVALNGPAACIRLGNGLKISPTILTHELTYELCRAGRLQDHAKKELYLALRPLKKKNVIKDLDGLPSIATYLQGRTGSVSGLAAERVTAIQESGGTISQETLQKLLIVDGAKSLYDYVKKTKRTDNTKGL